MNKWLKHLELCSALLGLAVVTITLPTRSTAQDEEDPPTRVARLGYMQGSVSFEPAGEDEWVGAVWNRPLTTGDNLWSDNDSRAALQLGSASIRLSGYTGISFLNLNDNTVQVQLSSGTINVRVWQLRPDDDFEIDTPNLAYVITSPGSYRIYADQNGSDTTVAVRSGDGQATGNGETYSLQAGQVGYFSGTESLYADVEDIGPPDPFDTWADERDRRYEESRSAQYVSRAVVGYEDLDEYGDWRDDPNYGHVWFPNRVAYGWAPYHEGHWVWIDPWGYTWVDDNPWGYAPFHYGRWVFVGGRWGWIAGPPAVAPVYAPALVVFVGGGGGWGGNIGWFPLGPREVYVPSYPVSQTYMTQINISNTNVSTTVVTNVYNTTIVNKTTITNVTYVNKSVPGAVTAVPQGAFTSAQPVAKMAVRVTPQQVAAAPITHRVAVNPTPEAVLGAKASAAGHVAVPPAAVMNRPVVAKKTPPPPPVPVAKQLQAMAAHPGQPLPPKELASLRPPAAMHPAVRVAPPGKPAVPTTGHAPAPRPGQPAAAHAPAPRSGPPAAAGKEPENRLPAAPSNHPEPGRPPAAQPSHPEMNRPTEAPAHSPAAQPNRPQPARPATPPQQHPAAAAKPVPQQHPPAAARPAAPPPKQPAKPMTPEEKKRQEQQKPPGG
jgi:hypothetical protein